MHEVTSYQYYLYIDDPTKPIGVYPGAAQGPDVYYFDSINSARNSNCHGLYADRVKYKVGKVKVIREFSDVNEDPPTQDEIDKAKTEQEAQAAIDMATDAWREKFIRTNGRDPYVDEELDFRFVHVLSRLVSTIKSK